MKQLSASNIVQSLIISPQCYKTVYGRNLRMFVFCKNVCHCQALPAQPHVLWERPEAGLLNKRLMLSSNFRCDQIQKYEIYDFGHTLLCYLSRTQMFNKPASGAYPRVVHLQSASIEQVLTQGTQYIIQIFMTLINVESQCVC